MLIRRVGELRASSRAWLQGREESEKRKKTGATCSGGWRIGFTGGIDLLGQRELHDV